ncbi:PD-(D/E)XK nuclease family protein [Pusillimonas sp. CC-YST705]|uniref:PD-(D/E)XK nuclease family protein n=1 Tax=Mesopusillimonas faecipullorum TaxID=2755040 RepID=A0ABS8CBM1_9BURK|nr:PD-(D/E)XK nuclease family protein [Mesopusillimonas faecipullorum]MCB5363259.1 PD-(D/E)XK nuclease family protein [Mesopusillimonas faecipullorum]
MKASLIEISLDDLADARLGRVLVLTVNNRHARRLLSHLSSTLGAERPVMAVPDILPFKAWVRQATEQLAFVDGALLAAHRLDAFGARLLWQQVIRESEPEHYLLDIPQAAKLASEADQLMSSWMLSVPDSACTPDYERFAAWREAYRRRLDEADAEDDTLGLERVSEAMARGQLQLDFDTVVLAGFNELSPRLHDMLDTWAASGTRLGRLTEHLEPASSMVRVCAPSPEKEWQWAVQWAYDQLRQDAQGCYAILAPQLESQVPLAHRLLHGKLSEHGFAYNIAVARPLAQWPMVRAAVLWLELMVQSAAGSCTPAAAGQALLAGHCAAHEAEAGARGMLDAQWRHARVLTLMSPDLLHALHEATPRLAQAWSLLQEQLPHEHEIANISQWVIRIKALLSTLGFPGGMSLDSVAHQVLEAFEQALDNLGRQRVVLQNIGFAQAVRALSTLLLQTTFQPQRDLSARLDVLGLLEAEGGRWDGVWVLGLNDEVLPAAPSPNPFIPLVVQRHAGTPRATPERELEWARASYEMLKRSAPILVVSSAAFEGERELRPSPFVARLPLSEIEIPNDEPAVAVMELLIDDQGPILSPGSSTPGGVAVLETQARNPLWAFVRFRLGARQLAAYADPAQQAVRGMFLHSCAELFCTAVRSHQQLLALQQDGGHALSELLQAQIARAAHEHLGHYAPVVRDLECARALGVMTAWAQLEANREPYEIVALEEASVWQHGALNLKLRLDRVDKLASGERVVIDYKTGGARLDPHADWVRRPPLSLQLPFYAAVLGASQNDVSALVLMRLHAKQVAVSGLTDREIGLEGLAQSDSWQEFEGLDWSEIMARWRQDIESLAQAYANGWAANNTRHASDLEYCDVLPMLRLYEEADDDI